MAVLDLNTGKKIKDSPTLGLKTPISEKEDSISTNEMLSTALRMEQMRKEPITSPKKLSPEEVFESVTKKIPMTPEQKRSLSDEIFGTGEAALTALSGIIAEPAGGVVGGVMTPFIGLEGGEAMIGKVREKLTFEPRGLAGKEKLQTMGETLQPIAEGLQAVEKGLGKTVLDVTGSPELATVAHSIPTAMLEAIGVGKIGKTGAISESTARALRLKDTTASARYWTTKDALKLPTNVKKAIIKAAPEIKQLKKARDLAYKKLDESGIKVKPAAYAVFADNLATKLKRQGLRQSQAPKAYAALEEILKGKGEAKSLADLDELRKIAGDATMSKDAPDVKYAGTIVNEIDKSIDNLSARIGGKFKEARGLAQRAFKQKELAKMLEKAAIQKSGPLNGVSIQATALLKRIIDGKAKGYTKAEIKALKTLSEGTRASNMAKELSKLGFGDKQASNMLLTTMGAGGVGVIGANAFGPAGTALAALPVTIGEVSKRTLKRLTDNNIKYADALMRAGKNAEEITKAYIKYTPIAKRNVSDLTDLLLQEGVDPSKLKVSSKTSDVIANAKYFATELNRKLGQLSGATIATTPKITEGNNDDE